MRNKKLIILLSILFGVTLLVVLSSVIFSVKQVYGYCYNDEDGALCSSVSSGECIGSITGKSIFMVNEDEIKALVEMKNSNVKVINVERKFPNLIYINFVKIFPYLVYETEDSALHISNESKILSISEKQSVYSERVRIITTTTPDSTAVGQALFAQNKDEYEILREIVSVMERIDLHSRIIDMFEFIDLTKTVQTGLTYIKTRSGVYIEIQNGKNDIGNKLRTAISVYVSNQTQYMTNGTIIVPSASKASYSKDNRYENGVA